MELLGQFTEGYLFLDFYGDWCNACDSLGVVLGQVEKKGEKKKSFHTNLFADALGSLCAPEHLWLTKEEGSETNVSK